MKKSRKNVVYSTNPDFSYEHEESDHEGSIDIGEQHLKVFRDRKNRKGKTVTVVSGFIGPTEELKDLEKTLKSFCGTGGTVKDGEIQIQGDMVKKVTEKLTSLGYKYKVSGG